ncbi:hypothetical protein [Actinomycetospora termitidis]|uniref:Nitrite/Sulfite reductase ferredoxin-like domain-containing protein n=1 Tax=Actinomycetospora termitidis TaxID=3053470 RepID=A0ABT7MDU0_9PSEU|nr:hypothetical protein [Actinomycetospora sp. Odt1-22]MDL5158835.1 hypothetical protein [Actinomycetospora sp. Odt1-22]
MPRTRSRPDACPGAWRRHDAADGALARFRPVGGATTADELRLLAGAAAAGGSPIELTSRGSWQVRGLAGSTADDLADALRSDRPDALVDARGRDVPCSIIASPRSARVDPVAGTVAAALRGRTDVPGRLLVAIEDRAVRGGSERSGGTRVPLTRGVGDVSGQGADIAVVVNGPSSGSRTPPDPDEGPLDDGAALLLDGTDTGLRADDPAALALAAVDAFTTHRGSAWRVRELDDAARTALLADLRDRTTPAVGNLLEPGPADPTRLGPDGTTLEVLPRLGEVDLATAVALLELMDRGATLRATPWRTLVLRDGPADAEQRLAGLVETDPVSRWRGVSACVGAPRCRKSLSDVRGDLAAAVASGHVGGLVHQHWVGCSRACGTPGGRVAVVEATEGRDQGRASYRTVVRSGKVTG